MTTEVAIDVVAQCEALTRENAELRDKLAAAEERAESAREVFREHLHRLQDQCAEMAWRAKSAEIELNEARAGLKRSDAVIESLSKPPVMK